MTKIKKNKKLSLARVDCVFRVDLYLAGYMTIISFAKYIHIVYDTQIHTVLPIWESRTSLASLIKYYKCASVCQSVRRDVVLFFEFIHCCTLVTLVQVRNYTL